MPRGSPEWQRAKTLLEQDYLAVEGIQEMTLDELIALRPEIYGKVKLNNLCNNWKAMKERTKADKDKPPQRQGRKKKKSSGPTAWEIAKPLLQEDYLSGKATADIMTPDEVIALRKTIYGKVPRSNFLTNWRSLKKRIDEEKEWVKKGTERYLHDTAIYPLAKDLPWEWHGSEAERLLKKDVAKGRHLRYNPQVMYLKRKAYQEFDYQISRQHVHQEARSARESPYWMVQREKKKKALQDAIEQAKKQSH
mmetsp:Transcript_27301/g.66240  ORF Transcript_27301/g.66240 Transcript_27301/m.66240 type:complete len:250 (-) Transcript_27301:48-797(-)